MLTFKLQVIQNISAERNWGALLLINFYEFIVRRRRKWMDIEANVR